MNSLVAASMLWFFSELAAEFFDLLALESWLWLEFCAELGLELVLSTLVLLAF